MGSPEVLVVAITPTEQTFTIFRHQQKHIKNISYILDISIIFEHISCTGGKIYWMRVGIRILM